MEKKNLSAILVAGLFVMSFALISTFAVVPVSAVSDTCGSSCPVSVTPHSGAPGSGFNISATGNPPIGYLFNLFLVGVVTPGGQVYMWFPSPNNQPETNGVGTCNIPFGVSGSLSESGSMGVCTPPNTVSWVEQTNPSPLTNLSALESACTTGTFGSYTSSPTDVGSTSESGTYNVIACWITSGLPNQYSFATTTFSVTSPQTNGVPEFPIASLSFVLLVALLLPALLLMSRKFRARPVL